MRYTVEQELYDLGLKVYFPKVVGFDNTWVCDEWVQERMVRHKAILDELETLDLKAHPILDGFNTLHDAAGVRRKHNVAASTTLLRLLSKRGSLPIINQVVDIYNTISMETKLALGAHDLDHVTGDVSVRRLDGTEGFVPLGATEPEPVRAGDYAYVDAANDVLCRLEVRQVEKTATRGETKHAFFICQGNANTSDDYLVEAAERIVDDVTRFCGGYGYVIAPEIV